MFSNLILGFTSMAYLALIAINIYKPKGTGDQLVGWGFIVLSVVAFYVICSLMLTINLMLKGKFDWIAESGTIRNGIIGLGWLSLMAGVIYSTMINVDWKDSSTSNVLGLIMVHYGAIWIPLLMLVPYAVLLNLGLFHTASPYLFKAPLLVGCFIGIAFHFLSYKQLGKLFHDTQAIGSKKYEKEMKLIGLENSVVELLYYMYEGTDARLTQAALVKLKKNENLEMELLTILNQCDENSDYLRVIAFLEHHPVEQKKLFIEPINKVILKISEELKYRLQSFGSENDFLELLNVDGLCHIIDTQFKIYKGDFLENMLKIQAELEKEPKPDFMEVRNKYKQAVKTYLAAN